MQTHRTAIAVLVCATAISCGRGETRHADNPTPADSPAPTATPVAAPTFEDFSKRLEAYLEVRRRVEASLPKLEETSDPAKISAREKALGQAIRDARRDAVPGDVFAEAAVKEFRRIIEANFNGRTPEEQAALLKEVPMKVPPRINADYPTSLPLATVPPSLLLNLPTLPDVLEYRFLGRHFILRDVKGNIIIDVVPNAVPASAIAAARGRA